MTNGANSFPVITVAGQGNLSSIWPNDSRERLPKRLVSAKRWLLWKADKQPFYPDGTPRSGTLDAPHDVSKLGTFDQVLDVLVSTGEYEGVGFALGFDGEGYWQGFDADDLTTEQIDAHLSQHDNLGYMEVSPSGRGIHVIGYGRHFKTLGANGTNVEAYAEKRYFTFTGERGRGEPTCISDFIENQVAALHARHNYVKLTEQVVAHPKLVSELRSALAHMRADSYETWIAMGHALRELGETGRGLWWDWSQTSNKCKSGDALRWDTFKPNRTGYQAVFACAQAHGWVNPSSNGARLETPTQGDFKFRFSRPGESTVQIDYLIDPWLPRAMVIGCFGRGEAGKSSWTASGCAAVSNTVSTLWISSEEDESHIRARHMGCGGQDRTLAVPVVLPTQIDPITKKAVRTSFNVYQHLEPAIQRFPFEADARADRPLGIVVLDAVVALSAWGKGESPNDDAAVKKLIAFLTGIAEKYRLTILMLGHLNKRKHDHIADSVLGATAWTASPRLSYKFEKDEEVEFQGFVRTAKQNTGTHYGATYRTYPVHVLRMRDDGKPSVLCGAVMGETVWGELALREAIATEDDPYLNKIEKKRAKVQAIVDRALGLLQTGATSRKAVEAMLGGEKVSKRHWQEADEILHREHGVQMQNAEHGVRIYSRRET